MKTIVVLGDFIEDKNALIPVDAAIQSGLKRLNHKSFSISYSKRRKSIENEIWYWNEY